MSHRTNLALLWHWSIDPIASRKNRKSDSNSSYRLNLACVIIFTTKTSALPYPSTLEDIDNEFELAYVLLF